MPSQTFINLNQEKKSKIINAAIEEFSEKNIGEASINKIVKLAKISRGSFYTYFNDKYDLVHYLIESVKQNLYEILERKFIDSNRSFHQLMIIVHDELYSLLENAKYSALIKNISLFFHNHFIEGHNEIPESMQYDFKLILKYINKEEFIKTTDEYLFNVMMITQAILKEVLLITIVRKSTISDSRNRFKDLLKLIEQGYRRS